MTQQTKPKRKSRAKPKAVTREQVLAAIQDNLAKGMTATFDATSWTFKRGVREDSGTLSQPIFNIKKCADLVCQFSINAGKLKLGLMDG